jgi:hypothetical protein
VESFGHWNTNSWKGDVDPQNVNVQNVWNRGFEETANGLRACGLYSEDELDFKNILVLKPMAALLNRNGNTSALSAAAESDDEESCSPANADTNETEELASLEMDLNEE